MSFQNGILWGIIFYYVNALLESMCDNEYYVGNLCSEIVRTRQQGIQFDDYEFMRIGLIVNLVQGLLPRVSRCMYCSKPEGGQPKQTARKTPEPEKPATTTTAKPSPAPEEIDDNTKYQCDSYLNHGNWSFYDIEAQMMARRVGQPSSKEPLAAP